MNIDPWRLYMNVRSVLKIPFDARDEPLSVAIRRIPLPSEIMNVTFAEFKNQRIRREDRV